MPTWTAPADAGGEVGHNRWLGFACEELGIWLRLPFAMSLKRDEAEGGGSLGFTPWQGSLEVRGYFALGERGDEVRVDSRRRRDLRLLGLLIGL
jgi:hypothetical protein